MGQPPRAMANVTPPTLVCALIVGVLMWLLLCGTLYGLVKLLEFLIKLLA